MKFFYPVFFVLSLCFPLRGAPIPTAFSPEFEGVYSLQIQCPPHAESKFCTDYQGDHYLIVTNTFDALRLEIFDSESCERRPLYQFIASEIAVRTKVTEVRAASLPVSRLAEIELSFERLKYGDPIVSGWLRNPALGFDLKVDGDQLAGGSPYYQGESFGGSFADIAGSYEGTVGKRRARLHLRRSALTPELLGTYTNLDDGNAFDFRVVSYDAKFGTLALVGVPDPKEINSTNFFKWTLRVKKSADDPLKLEGVARFNYCAGKSTLRFTKVVLP